MRAVSVIDHMLLDTFRLLVDGNSRILQSLSKWAIRVYCDGKISGSSNLMELHARTQTAIALGSKEDYLDRLCKCGPYGSSKHTSRNSFGTARKDITRALRTIGRRYGLIVEFQHRPLEREIVSHLKQGGCIVMAYRYGRRCGSEKEGSHYFLVESGYEFSSGFAVYTVNAFENKTMDSSWLPEFRKNHLMKYRGSLDAWFISHR